MVNIILMINNILMINIICMINIIGYINRLIDILIIVGIRSIGIMIIMIRLNRVAIFE